MDAETARRNVAENIRTLRAAHGYGSRELGRKLPGGDEIIISSYETGRSSPRLRNLVALCKLLRTTPDELMGYRPLEIRKER